MHVKLKNLLETTELQKNNCEEIIQDLSQEIEKVKLELHEALAKKNDAEKKLDDVGQTHVMAC